MHTYIARKEAGEAVNLRELAEAMDVPESTLRGWKRKDGWDKNPSERPVEVPPPPSTKRRGGAPKGSRNALGNKGGGPVDNKNSEKHGGYARPFLDSLTPEEKAWLDSVPLSGREALEHEMRVLKCQENRILDSIAVYEQAASNSLFLCSSVETTGDNGDSRTDVSDSAFTRAQKLRVALNQVQGRIAKIGDSLRAMDEFTRREKLEKERMELMRMRVTGAIEVDPETDGAIEL